jgi:hypothetical protein
VLFGGANGFGDTWTWDGASWLQVASTGPPARYGHAMAYDSAHGKTVLFGGNAGTAGNPTYLGDTWTWDGASWTQVASTGPPARYNAAMAYDSARGKTVLFGGNAGPASAPVYLGDTWGWDGTSWMQIAPAGPAPRALHAMAYDSARGETVLFGGDSLGGVLGDTWMWEGTGSWTQVASTGPPGRYGHAMVYDSARGRTVLFGGTAVDNFSDTWEYHTRGGACSCSGGGNCVSSQCDTGYCVDGVCCEGSSLATTSPPNCGTCQDCNLTASPGVCASVPSGTGDPDSCSGYLCTASGGCTATCTSDAGCQSGYFCSGAGTCLGRLANGAACNTMAGTTATTCMVASCHECTSGFTCGADTGNGAAGECCKGSCSPMSLTCEKTWTGCDASGACTFSPLPAGTACGTAYVCDGTSSACPTSCTSDSACQSGYYCSGAGTCVKQIATGSACNTTAGSAPSTCKVAQCRECLSGHTCGADTGSGAAGNCCAGGCTPAVCQTWSGCDKTGACVLTASAQGTQCGGPPAGCNGSNQAVHPAVCDGNGNCKVPPPSSCGNFVCRNGACVTSCTSNSDCTAGSRCETDAGQAGKCISGATCDGDHTVTSAVGKTTDCSPYKCQQNGTCLTSCASLDQCVAPDVCDSNNQCVPPPSNGASGSSGGCACRLGGGERETGAPLLVSLLLVLTGIARRRRQS